MGVLSKYLLYEISCSWTMQSYSPHGILVLTLAMGGWDIENHSSVVYYGIIDYDDVLNDCRDQ